MLGVTNTSQFSGMSPVATSLITLIPLLACYGAAAQRLTRWRHNRVVVSGAELCPILMTRTSSWIALRNPTFGKLWFATVVSGICVSAHEMAAIWVINSISTAGSHSTMLLSLMSTAATLPFFLFILPAGALADMMGDASRKGILRTLRRAVSSRKGVRRHLMRNAEPLAQSSGPPVPVFP
jgi:Transmembrane secretion effector